MVVYIPSGFQMINGWDIAWQQGEESSIPNNIFKHPLYSFYATKFLCVGRIWYL